MNAKKLTKADVEQAARADFRSFVGRAILVSEVEGMDDKDTTVTIKLDPPAVAVIDRVSPDRIEQDIVRWTDADHLDPYYDLTFVEPDPRLSTTRSHWTFGPCRSLDGKIERPDFELAPPEIQVRYGRSILANYVRLFVSNPGAGMERLEEFDRTPFDATAAVLDLQASEIHTLKDRGEAVESLVPQNLRPLDGDRSGGFDVLVTDAITAYFAVDALSDVTDDMIAEARAERGMPAPSSAPTP